MAVRSPLFNELLQHYQTLYQLEREFAAGLEIKSPANADRHIIYKVINLSSFIFSQMRRILMGIKPVTLRTLEKLNDLAPKIARKEVIIAKVIAKINEDPLLQPKYAPVTDDITCSVARLVRGIRIFLACYFW